MEPDYVPRSDTEGGPEKAKARASELRPVLSRVAGQRAPFVRALKSPRRRARRSLEQALKSPRPGDINAWAGAASARTRPGDFNARETALFEPSRFEIIIEHTRIPHLFQYVLF